jgi:hypothetical protein
MNPTQLLAEVATTMVVAIQAMIASYLIAALPPESAELMMWTLLPMIGATLAAGGAFCFNSQPEVRKIVVGRCLFGIVIGVLGPRLMSMAHPWLKEILVDPLILVGAGFVHGFVAYLMSWPFVRKAYERAPAVADRQMQFIEHKIDQKIAQNNPTTKLEP